MWAASAKSRVMVLFGSRSPSGLPTSARRIGSGGWSRSRWEGAQEVGEVGDRQAVNRGNQSVNAGAQKLSLRRLKTGQAVNLRVVLLFRQPLGNEKKVESCLDMQANEPIGSKRVARAHQSRCRRGSFRSKVTVGTMFPQADVLAMTLTCKVRSSVSALTSVNPTCQCCEDSVKVGIVFGRSVGEGEFPTEGVVSLAELAKGGGW